MGGTEGNPKLPCPAFSSLQGEGRLTVLVWVVSLYILISSSGGQLCLASASDCPHISNI